MYTCHMLVFKKEFLQKIGGFREGFEGAQDWDLVLRASEKTNRIGHIPDILYYWRIQTLDQLLWKVIVINCTPETQHRKP